MFEEPPKQPNHIEQSPEEVPFYQQVCDYYENVGNEPESRGEEEPVDYQHQVQPIQIPNTLVVPGHNIISQKVSTVSLKD